MPDQTNQRQFSPAQANLGRAFSSKAFLVAAGILTALVLLASACGSSNDTSTSASANSGNPNSGNPSSNISGTVEISGSSTVEPISVRVAELFEDIQPDVLVNVDGPGTGDGFKLFCSGDIDISNASRQIRDAEIQDCSDSGVRWVELRVAIDGIAVLTNSANKAVECLSFADLYALIGPESEGFNSWEDAQYLATELGSDTTFTPAGLDIYGPGEESGTFDSFIELVIEDFAHDREKQPITRPDYNANANDNLILTGIQGKDTSLGWVGFAFAANAQNVKLIDIDGGDGACVSAGADTIASGVYPISRGLYIYVNMDNAAENPAVAAYVDYYMNEGLSAAVADVGYVELTEEAKNQTRNQWSDRVTNQTS